MTCCGRIDSNTLRSFNIIGSSVSNIGCNRYDHCNIKSAKVLLVFNVPIHSVDLQCILSHPMPEQRFYIVGESVVNVRRDGWHVVLRSAGLIYNAGALI